MKTLIKASAIFAFLLGSLLVVLLTDGQEVFFESSESKTRNGDPVYNHIQLISEGGRDIWMMNQSHHGPSGSGADLDRLAIVVDRTQSPKKARFYQFPSGDLRWSETLPAAGFSVSCFLCHNNGPRAIRPNLESTLVQPSVLERLKIFSWNLRISLYGRVLEHEYHSKQDLTAKTPFRYRSAFENENLSVGSCTKCHAESGFKARGALKRQQVATIRHMVESGHMPPAGFSLSKADAQSLKRFYQGL